MIRVRTCALIALSLTPVIFHSGFATSRVGYAQETQATAAKRTTESSEQAIDLFKAIEKELVSVKFIPLAASRANVVIENEGDDPIDLVLPQAFGAVHVLAQFGGQGAGGLGQGGGFQGGAGGGGLGAGGAGQNLGGGFGGGGGFQGGAGGGGFQGGGLQGGAGGGFGGGLGGGGGFFRVKPDRKATLKVKTFCLQHGRPDPNPRMKYAIVPLETVSKSKLIESLCQDLGSGRLTQEVAQAVAWHEANELNWDRLARLNRRESRYTGIERMFNLDQLTRARSWLEQASDSASEQSPGELLHSSRETYSLVD